MNNVKDFEPLSGEYIEASLRPHPASFIKYYFSYLYLAFLAAALYTLYNWINNSLLLNQGAIQFLNVLFGIIPWLSPKELVFLIIFWITLILSGILMKALLASKKPLLYVTIIGVLGTLLEIYLYPEPVTKPVTLLFFAVLGLILMDAYRRGHKFLLTNYRVVAVKKFIVRDVKEIMYDEISQVYLHQGLLGRLLNYGTIILIPKSGFIYGGDKLRATAPGAEDLGGKRDLDMAKNRLCFSLHGIPNPKKVRGIICSRIFRIGEAA